MVLSTWNSEYALQWQCTKTICETSNAFIGAYCYPKIHFHPSGPFKSIKTMLKSLHVLLGLSPVWNCYPKGCHKKRTTWRSIISYDDIKDGVERISF